MSPDIRFQGTHRAMYQSIKSFSNLLEDNCVTWVSQPQQPAIDIDDNKYDWYYDDYDDDDADPNDDDTCKGD